MRIAAASLFLLVAKVQAGSRFYPNSTEIRRTLVGYAYGNETDVEEACADATACKAFIMHKTQDVGAMLGDETESKLCYDHTISVKELYDITPSSAANYLALNRYRCTSKTNNVAISAQCTTSACVTSIRKRSPGNSYTFSNTLGYIPQSLAQIQKDCPIASATTISPLYFYFSKELNIHSFSSGSFVGYAARANLSCGATLPISVSQRKPSGSSTTAEYIYAVGTAKIVFWLWSNATGVL